MSSKATQLKVAIVGCGKIADAHIEEIAKLPAARVVAVCDLELLQAEQAGARYGIAGVYDDFDRLLAEARPDVVHITTPPASHLSLTRRAVDAGCHVFVEKPLALNLADARALVDCVTRANKKMTIGWTYLFDPPAIAMRELIAAGVLGDPVHAESFYGYDLSGPFGTALLADGQHWVHGLPGKLFHNNIDHLLSKLLEFFDEEHPQVHAHAFTRRSRRFGDERDRMHDELRLVFMGQKVTAYGTFSAHARPAGHWLRVLGTRNTIRADYVARTVTCEAAPRLPSAVGRLLPAFDQALAYLREGGRNVARFARADFHFFAGLNRLCAAFYDSILDDAPLPIPTRDILRVSAMMDDIFRQIRPEQEAAA